MREIRTLLVDDEPIANEGLRALLEQHSDVRLIGECRDGNDAVTQIRRLTPDVVFLDVQMPELDAFGVIEMLGCDSASILVFVTAHDSYALRAFDVQATDYLLKPVSEYRLGRALDRVRRQLAERHTGDSGKSAATAGVGSALAAAADSGDMEPARSMASSTVSNSYLSTLIVRTGRRSTVISVPDIDWIAADDYCVNIMVSGRRHVLRASLASLEDRLDPAMFVRAHRSALVNITRVKEWHQHPFRRLVLVLADETRLSVSKRRKTQLLDSLHNLPSSPAK